MHKSKNGKGVMKSVKEKLIEGVYYDTDKLKAGYDKIKPLGFYTPYFSHN